MTSSLFHKLSPPSSFNRATSSYNLPTQARFFTRNVIYNTKIWNKTRECIPVGCVPSATVAVCFQGGSPYTPLEQAPPWEQAPPPEQTPCCNACWDSTPPPPVNRITDTCKNITFATSLRTVTSFTSQFLYLNTQRISY